MAKYSLSDAAAKQINELAADCFKHHPSVEKLIATTDGNIFFEKDKNSALNHARTLADSTLIDVVKGEAVEARKGDASSANKPAEKKAAAEKKGAEKKAAAEKKEAEKSEAEK